MITITGLRTELMDGATLRFYPILSEWKTAEQHTPMLVNMISKVQLLKWSQTRREIFLCG